MNTSASSTAPGYIEKKDSHLKRLRRIEGQIRGLQRMVEDDKYCIDILTQVSAATKALQSFSLELLDEHLEHCVVDAARRGGAEGEAKGPAGSELLDEHLEHCVVDAARRGGDEADEKVREASEAIARLVRS